MTNTLLSISFVPRHSNTSVNLYHDWQKPRRASFIPASDRGEPDEKYYSTASMHSATLTKFYRRAVSGQLLAVWSIDNIDLLISSYFTKIDIFEIVM
jgi:hypothetical protein